MQVFLVFNNDRIYSLQKKIFYLPKIECLNRGYEHVFLTSYQISVLRVRHDSEICLINELNMNEFYKL